NPDTPLAFLPPEYANQVEVARYIGAVTFGAYIWDIAANLSSDYKLLFKRRIYYPTIVYYSSRVFTLGYIIACFVFEVGRVSNCQALMIALGACNTLSQSSTAMLFLLRARAVWQDNKYVKTFLTILWLGVLGGTTTVPIGLSGVHVGPTLQCIAKSVPEYEEASPISVLIFDTFIFFTIAYRILVNIWDQEEKGVHFQAFFGLRTSLPDLSRALLVGGQKYYLLALVWSIAVIVLGALPGISPVYKSMCTIPQFATNSAMACLVFRQIKFGLTEADGT
ncbi:hypothetical protein GYMLUDRAFT_112062, partial [Collybiopsis luxurians FD-317 M1]